MANDDYGDDYDGFRPMEAYRSTAATTTTRLSAGDDFCCSLDSCDVVVVVVVASNAHRSRWIVVPNLIGFLVPLILIHAISHSRLDYATTIETQTIKTSYPSVICLRVCVCA